jgi:hypothetical protein
MAILLVLCASAPAAASEATRLDLTGHAIGLISLVIFVVASLFVMTNATSSRRFVSVL